MADVVLQFGTDSLNLHNHIIEEKLKNVLLTEANKESAGSRAVFSDKTDNRPAAAAPAEPLQLSQKRGSSPPVVMRAVLAILSVSQLSALG